MWDLRFDSTTNRGIRVAAPGEALRDGEYSVKRHRTQCAWFLSSPESYQFVGGVFGPYPGVKAEQDERVAELAELAARVATIEQARELSGVHKYTIEQAENFINSTLDQADTAAKMKEAVRTLFLKVVPHIIRT